MDIYLFHNKRYVALARRRAEYNLFSCFPKMGKSCLWLYLVRLVLGTSCPDSYQINLSCQGCHPPNIISVTLIRSHGKLKYFITVQNQKYSLTYVILDLVSEYYNLMDKFRPACQFLILNRKQWPFFNIKISALCNIFFLYK